MARGLYRPTDQSLSADAPGAPTSDSASASPASGNKSSVVLSVTFHMNTITGSATVAYNNGAGDTDLYSETDLGDTGVQTRTFSIGTNNLATLNLVAKTASAVDPCSISVSAWHITFPRAGVIADTGDGT